jgi:predicted RNA-binding Zn ribbon-like protein
VMETTEEQRGLELCLDFSNTIDWRNGRQGKTPSDNIRDYDGLVEWSRGHALIGTEEARSLDRQVRQSGRGGSVFRRAIQLRETIYRVFSAIAHEKKPSDRDLQALNGFVSESMAKSKIVRVGEGFQLSCYGTEVTPDMMLWPIARSAADLLTSDRLVDLRECANEEEGCGWLFLDDSKSHSRKWCSMKGCGNTAKARRFYEAHRKLEA